MSFVRRKINLSFRLGTGNYGETGFNTVEVSGLRCNAQISRGGSPSFGNMTLRVFGLKPEIVNELVTLGTPIAQTRRNVVTLMAGDDDSGMQVVFIGTIQTAWADMNQAPEPSLIVTAVSGALEAMRPIAPTSVNGGADVEAIMASLARQAGLSFENTGVQVRIANPYLSGTAVDQMQSLASAAGINYEIDKNTLAIWPKGGVRGGLVPQVSQDQGLVGWPSFTQYGMAFTTEFNSTFQFGGRVRLKSNLLAADGEWYIYMITHELASEQPDGPWFTHMECVQYGTVAPPI